MTDHGVTASFGRTRVCWDNASMESTWATIKREIAHIHGDWETMTRSQLRTVLFDYIETFYNRQRHQATPRSPNTSRDLHCLPSSVIT